MAVRRLGTDEGAVCRTSVGSYSLGARRRGAGGVAGDEGHVSRVRVEGKDIAAGAGRAAFGLCREEGLGDGVVLARVE